MTTPARVTYMHRVNANPLGLDGQIRCPAHGELAVKFTSRTANNPNREFYKCPRSKEEPSCSFFIWGDDPKLTGETLFVTEPSPTPVRNPRPTQQGTPPTVADTEFAIAASPLSAKRPRSGSPQISSTSQLPGAFPSTPTRTPRAQNLATPSSAYTPSQRQSRLAAIMSSWETTGSAQGSTATGRSHNVSNVADRPVIPTARPIAGSPRFAPRPTKLETVSSRSVSRYEDSDDDDDAASHPSPSKRTRFEDSEYDYSEVGSLYDIGIQTSPGSSQSVFDGMSERAVEAELDFTQNQLPVASTPTGSPTGGESTSRRLSELPGDISQGYLTPPGSSEPQQGKRQISPRHGTAPLYPPALWKGKGRDLGDQSHQQWHLEDDPENPFQDRSAAMREPLGSSHPGHSPPQASGEGESLSLADHLAAQLADLRALPDQIRKLERQLKAAHNSLAARDRKIQELQQETAQLRAQNRASETRMEVLRARR